MRYPDRADNPIPHKHDAVTVDAQLTVAASKVMQARELLHTGANVRAISMELQDAIAELAKTLGRLARAE